MAMELDRDLEYVHEHSGRHGIETEPSCRNATSADMPSKIACQPT
jgi:hypothetical protein